MRMKSKPLGEKIKPSTWRNWLGQWAELLQSGMPALDALALSSELQHAHSQAELLRLGLSRTSRFLQEGQSLQTAFRASFTKIPMHLEIALVCAQASGDLGTALQTQLDRWKITSDGQDALGKSLVYPLLVLTLAVACWVLLHQVSAPHFTQTTASSRNAIKWSDALLIAGVFLLLFAGYCRMRQHKAKPELQALLPHNAWLSSNFYHVIACELHAGLDLMHCLRHRTLPSTKWLGVLQLSTGTLLSLNSLMHRIQQQLKQGMSLGQSMSVAGAPGFLVRQSQLAEQTGNLAYCFFLAAKVYEMQARETQQRLQSTLPTIALAIAALTLALAYQFTLAPLYDNLTGLQ
ncbi:type II secretion system F family protein [Limnobacter alexandrii]|jgi:type II secretory pathway component PulF|uniref:type II secretion system F family protein n=1 Tax=Limnobacter alexandrii TaxID=2570352 RepID=UPI001108DC12|nr:type II secretion system F family protein [Limnobacter alexandrii]